MLAHRITLTREDRDGQASCCLPVFSFPHAVPLPTAQPAM
ncbi:MAG: hypothetical protein OJF49_004162 [Ktedonobacterales bacterium]|nr:MAG: hypothetical protein OJF49_004162 [Ktedonobacterales bacterium]